MQVKFPDLRKILAFSVFISLLYGNLMITWSGKTVVWQIR